MSDSAVSGASELPAGVEREIVTMTAPGVTRAGAGGYPLQGFYTRRPAPCPRWR